MEDNIILETRAVISELLSHPRIADEHMNGRLLVIGCSSSEVIGGTIGKSSSPETAKKIVNEIIPIINSKGILLAAQCCEHLNRALIVEKETAIKLGLEPVSVVPKPGAGGAFAAAVWEAFSDPVAIENVKADLGLDIGDTMIGMHLKPVAVPIRLSSNKIGNARVCAAFCRPK